MLIGVRALAQVTTGQVSGYVRDPANKAVPHASVTGIDTERGFERSVFTDTAGFYRIAALPPSMYAVTALAPGFSAADLRVTVSSQLRVDLTLALPERRESIEVKVIPADRTDLGTVLDQS